MSISSQMNNEEIQISVIIPTCNRLEALTECLNNLEYQIQGEYSCKAEIIITDDSTTLEVKNYIHKKKYAYRWLRGPQKGPAANRNFGAKFAKGEWLLFIDDDCIPSRKILDEYSSAIDKNENIKVFEGSIQAHGEKSHFLQEAPINENGGVLWSCNFMISKKYFWEIGAFDEAFPNAFMEDVDLRYRIQKSATKILFLKDAYVIHPWRLERNIISKSLQRFKSIEFFVRKYPNDKLSISYKYFIKAYFVMNKYLIKKSFKYKFKGFAQKVVESHLQLYYAYRIILLNKKK